jgi:hypothetical protein
MAGFNIASFSSEIGKSGYLQTNKFYIQFPSPSILQNYSIDGKPVADIERMIQIRAESVKVPGIALLMGDVNRYGIGPVQKMPYNASFTTNSISFIADRNGAIYKYFYTWINSIFEFAGASGAPINGIPTVNRGASYQTEYKDNYTTDITVSVFNNTGEMIKQIEMLKAFPESLNEVPLDWNQNNELMKVTVSFSFRDWRMVGVPSNSPKTQEESKSPNITNDFVNILNLSPGSSISTPKNTSTLPNDYGKTN